MVIDEGLAAQAVFLKTWEGMSWEAQNGAPPPRVRGEASPEKDTL